MTYDTVTISQKEKAEFFLSYDWLNVDHNLKFIGTVNEIMDNPTMCGIIMPVSGDGFKDYIREGNSAKAVDSFKSFLDFIGIQKAQYKEVKIYKYITE